MNIEVGQAAPDFSAQDGHGNTIKLSDLKGKHVILYFYPKDDTPGCTQESCDFRDQHAQFEQRNAVIIGVSKDSAKSHLKFQDKYQLPFQLITDPETTLCQQYGVWVEKKMFSNTYMDIERSTFLIDPQGVVQKIWRKVKVKGHVDAVCKALTN